MYPHAEEFRPGRWLEPEWPTYREPLTRYPDISGDAAFGSGVRSCPGVELTRSELYTLIGGLIWAFDIKRKEGSEGQFVPWYETTPWIIATASSFPLDIKVRSERKADFLRGLDTRSDEPSAFSGERFGDWQGLTMHTKLTM